MWREGGASEVYLYVPLALNAALCADPRHYCGDAYISVCRGCATFQTGRYMTVTQYIHLNTPGQANGHLKVWINGRVIMDISNITFRSTYALTIDGLFFSTFFGGGSSGYATPTGILLCA